MVPLDTYQFPITNRFLHTALPVQALNALAGFEADDPGPDSGRSENERAAEEQECRDDSESGREHRGSDI